MSRSIAANSRRIVARIKPTNMAWSQACPHLGEYFIIFVESTNLGADTCGLPRGRLLLDWSILVETVLENAHGIRRIFRG
jgi:hypothetical protein